MNDVSSNPDLTVPSSVHSSSNSNSAKAAADAAAKLHRALGDPLPQSALGFFGDLWAVIVSIAHTIWRSIQSAWQPDNYVALACFFGAGVLFSDFAMRYVRFFSALGVILLGFVLIMTLMKRNTR